MSSERDFNDNTIQANLAEDRDLDCVVQTSVDRQTMSALDKTVHAEGWGHRAAFVRSLIVAALKQRGRLPM